MTIEVLVIRDPDGDDAVQVWADGVLAADAIITVVDAGRGWEFDDWARNACDAGLAATTPAARRAIFRAYLDPPGSEYIQGWPDD